MEIERKFLPKYLPENLETYPHRVIEQGYLCTSPVVRVRRSGEHFTLTYKGSGMMTRREENLPLTEEGYRHLIAKADGTVISKTRYCIPYGTYTVELDVFDPPFAPLVMAEVEFPTEEEAAAFVPPAWFGEDVTFDPAYHNSNKSKRAETWEVPAIRPGIYRHFKGNRYEVLGVAAHSETLQPMVVYRALYGEGGLWVRPAAMWNETVEREGKTFPRFTYIEGEEA